VEAAGVGEAAALTTELLGIIVHQTQKVIVQLVVAEFAFGVDERPRRINRYSIGGIVANKGQMCIKDFFKCMVVALAKPCDTGTLPNHVDFITDREKELTNNSKRIERLVSHKRGQQLHRAARINALIYVFTVDEDVIGQIIQRAERRINCIRVAHDGRAEHCAVKPFRDVLSVVLHIIFNRNDYRIVVTRNFIAVRNTLGGVRRIRAQRHIRNRFA
jgi:hypothetical protein